MKFPQWLMGSKQVKEDSASYWDEHWSDHLKNKDEFVADRKPTADFLFNHLDLSRGPLRCFDVAGGGGGVAYSLLEKNPALQITIGDISVRGAENLLGTRANYLYFDARQNTPLNMKFDRIWISELEYLLTDHEWVGLLRSCRNMLADGGRLAITTASVFNIPNTLLWIVRSVAITIVSMMLVWPVLNGVSRSLPYHRVLIRRASFSTRDEGVVKNRKRKYLPFNFGKSDVEIYGFILDKQ